MGRHSDRGGRASGARAAAGQAGARIVEVHDVGVSYGDVAALRGVSFSAGPGDFVAVTGHSGAGKTTLVNAIAGIVDLASGAIDLGAGRDRARDPASVAIIPQGNGLASVLTAYENVLAPLRARGHAPEDAAERATAALAAVGLGESGTHLIEELSGGQQQRAAVARGLAIGATVLLVLVGAASLGAARLLGLDTGAIGGMFAGMTTASPALDTATAATGGSPQPAIGFAIGYPVGVVVSLLVLSAVAHRPLRGHRDPAPSSAAGLLTVTVETPRAVTLPTGRTPFVAAVLLIVAGLGGLVGAFALTLDKFRLLENPGAALGCDVNPFVGCSPVINSWQASLFGFPNPMIGIASFSVVAAVGAAVLAGGRLARWYWLGLQAGATFGVVFVAWLAFQSLYRIGALCPYCLVVWVVVIPTFWYVTLRNLHAGAFGETAKRSSAAKALRSWHAPPLLAMFLLLLVLIAERFWSYWSTLL